MTYATGQQFVDAFGIGETTDLLRDELELLTPELLAMVMADAITGDPTDDEIAQARTAVARLDNAMVEAGKWMDGYFLSVVALPLTAEQIAAAPVKSCCLELARCYLKDDDDNMTEGAEKRCKRWVDWLRDVSAGKVKLVQEQVHSKGVRSGRMPSRYNWGAFGK